MDFWPLSQRTARGSNLPERLKISAPGDLFLLALFAYFLGTYGLGMPSLLVPLLAALRLGMGRITGSLALLVPLTLFYLHKDAWPQQDLVGCKTNLKHLATAMEMYSTDNVGLYPTSLKKLMPKYLEEIPQCPSAGRDTYSAGCQTARQPDVFSLTCSGSHHTAAGALENYPRYFNTQG